MLVTICSKSVVSVPICNHFHTVRANNGKITLFRGYPTLTPSFEGNPIIQGHEILSLKTRVFVAAHSEDFVILGVAVLIQTDGQTPRRWLRRAKHYMLMPVKIYIYNKKKSELMLMRRARSYSSPCSQIILVYLYPFCRNSLFCSQKSPKKSRKTNILKVQGHLRS